MVAIRFKSPQQRADGFMVLARKGRVRSLNGDIYVCSESSLPFLETQNIQYERVSLPSNFNDVLAGPDNPRTES